MNELRKDSMLVLPSEAIKDVDSLLSLLKLPNPAYANRAYMSFGANKIPEFNTYYSIDKVNRTITVPRNIPTDYYDKKKVQNQSSYGKMVMYTLNQSFRLRDYQETYFNKEVLPRVRSGEEDMNFSVPCGHGKCHGFGTKILMYDGTIKEVQDVVVGDLLMGDDSTPRRVLSLARGREEMYEVRQTKGDMYVVNKSHILSLKGKRTKGKDKIRQVDEIVNISVKDYLQKSQNWKNMHRGYRAMLEFPEKETLIDPYFLGVWLGDGTSRTTGVTISDNEPEMLSYISAVAKEHGCTITETRNDGANCATYTLVTERGKPNTLLQKLQKLSFILNKHIPVEYLRNSRKNRLELLAGLIDTDGSYSNHCLEITQKRKRLAYDIKLLCNTLGFYCKVTPKEIKGRIYYRMTISGNIHEIPTRIPRKQPTARMINKDPLVTGIEVVPIGDGDYYGFTLDGNHLYCLADCTVTHNTMMALFLASLRMTNVVVGVTTHKLAKQWIDAATFMFPDNTVSLYEPNKKKYQLTDIVISTYNTLGSEKCGKDFFAQFGHAIFDEVHRAAAKEFLPALESAVCKYRTSLSATFRRKDGLHEVLRHHCGQAMVMKRQTPGAAVIPLRTGITVDMEAMRVVDKRQTPVGDLSYLSDVVVREAEMEEKAGKVVDITYAPLTEQELLSKEKIKPKVTKVVVQFGATQKTYTGPVFPKFYAKGTLSSARIKSEVADDKDRQQLLLELLNECFQKGRNTLVLSARKDMLYALSDALTAAPYFIPNGIVVSQKSTKQREYCQRLGMTTDEQERYCVNESSVILGIDKLAEEGFDVERLDTLIIAHPIRDIEQAVGRILRIHKGKKPPMVFYLIDDIKTSKAAWMEARKQFMELENRVLPEVDFNAFKERYVKS